MSEASNMAERAKMFTCPICGKAFDNNETLHVHKEKEHRMTPAPPAGVG